VLQDLELSVSHQLSDAIRDLDLNYGVTQTNFNRWNSEEDEVKAVAAIHEVGRVTLDLLLQAQQRRADAQTAYYRSLVDYNRAIMRVHYRKGSLLEYNGIFLQEGPWPGKAYFDATRRARRRDAAMAIDYGFTRPNVMSRGVYNQAPGTAKGAAHEGPVPTIVPEPLAPPAEAIGPQASVSDAEMSGSAMASASYLETAAGAGTMEMSTFTTLPTTAPAAGAVVHGASAGSTPPNPFGASNAVTSPVASPAASAVPNPFGTTQSLPAAEASVDANASAAYEPQANYAPAATAANLAGWSGGQR
jgi:hypothetical protein